jgi:hypothetical protein
MAGRRVMVVTDYWAKPIPSRHHDWTATLDGYEPGEPVGYGESEADAIYDLFLEIESREEELEEKARDRA